MARLRVHTFSISVDGYGAGPRQSREEPLGAGGEALHEWMFPTRTFRQMGRDKGAEGTTGVDDEFMQRGFANIGAWILGRNMFGPVRGPWPDDQWKGWWGDEPPYHVPVFVLTRHPRKPVAMKGGTEFRFVGDIDDALRQATDAAGSVAVRRSSASICKLAWSTSCTSRLRPCSWARESTCSPASTSPDSTTR